MKSRLQIRNLRLRAFAENGSIYSRTVQLHAGLNIIQGANSSGKSICIMAILYALGAEGMLSAKRAVPLPYALTDFLKDGELEVRVLSSDVSLEIQNHRGEVLTLRRVIRQGPHAREDTHLVHTWNGTALSEERDHVESATDYYVRMPGSAKNEAGFHAMLANFLGWELPTVSKFDGSETLLYVECIFPLFLIEQKKGWSGLQARMPTYLGIRDVHMRAIEFLLDLHICLVRSRIQALEYSLHDCQAAWQGLLAGLEGIARSIGGIVSTRLPDEPGLLSATPSIQLPIDERWVNIEETIAVTAKAISKIDTDTVPSIQELASALEAQLEQAESEVLHLDALVISAAEELEFEMAQKSSAQERLTNLRIDLQKNKDVIRLRELGSASALKISENRCPTCQQPISGASGIEGPVMTLEENVTFIQDMIQAVSSSLRETEALIDARQLRLAALRVHRNEAKRRLRSLKESLVQDARQPATIEVERKAFLQQRLFSLKEIESAFQEKLREIVRMGREADAIRDELKRLRAEELSTDDRKKLKALGEIFSEQINDYGLESVRGARISISEQNYRPVAMDLPDLEFELSGSDLIRAIWAYYLSLLELGRGLRGRKCNHPGLLFMDEPRQQGVELNSLLAMLRRAASSREHQQQVIITLNRDDAPAVEAALQGYAYHVVRIEGLALERTELPALPGQDVSGT